jgi:hypothetical protein
MLGSDVPKDYLESIIDEADIKRDKRISYEEFLALWDEGEDVKRKQTLEDVKRRRLLNNTAPTVASAASSMTSLDTDRDDVMSDVSDEVRVSASKLFQQEKSKSVRLFADV